MKKFFIIFCVLLAANNLSAGPNLPIFAGPNPPISRNFLEDLFDNIFGSGKNAISQIIKSVKKILDGILSNLGDVVQDGINNIKDIVPIFKKELKNTIDAAKKEFKKLLSQAKKLTRQQVKEIKNLFEKAIGDFEEFMKDFTNTLGDQLKALAKLVSTDLKSAMKQIESMANDLGKKIIAAIKEKRADETKIRECAKQALDGIQTVLKPIMDMFAKCEYDFVNKVTDGVNNLQSQIQTVVTQIIKIGENCVSLQSAETFTCLMSNYSTLNSQVIAGIEDTVRNLNIQGNIDALNQCHKAAFGAATGALTGLANGFETCITSS